MTFVDDCRQKRQYMPVDLFIDGTNINQVHETSFL